MNGSLHVELNLFAISILLIMLVSRRGDSTHSLEQRLFNFALIANAITLVFDALLRVLGGLPSAGARFVYEWSIHLYYFSNPLICLSCLIYCDYKIFGSVLELKKRMYGYLAPLVITYAAFIVNIITGWLYGFTAEHLYARGPLFLLIPALMLIYPVWVEYLTIRYVGFAKTETEREELRMISLYMILPLVCLGIQLLVKGLQLVWISSVLSFVMIYVNIQNRQIYTDELTGVNNRRQISRAFARMTESLGMEYRLYAVMIDGDDFKQLNDTFGHGSGDKMLVRVANALEEVCSLRRDFLARLGGDEFLILAARRADERLELIGAIDAAVSRLNKSSDAGYVLSLSCGVAEYGKEGIDTLDRLLSAADKAMYQNKLQNKQLRKARV